MPPVHAINQQLRTIGLALDSYAASNRLELCIESDLLAGLREYGVGPGRVTGGGEHELMANAGREINLQGCVPTMDTADGHFSPGGNGPQGQMSIGLTQSDRADIQRLAGFENDTALPNLQIRQGKPNLSHPGRHVHDY